VVAIGKFNNYLIRHCNHEYTSKRRTWGPRREEGIEQIGDEDEIGAEEK
jgi:hypothetical protein